MNMMREALFYRELEMKSGIIECLLCPHGCKIPKGARGMCHARANKDGIVLVAENYAQVSSMSIDPIEKKPLYHFYPGSKAFSIGTWGCNLSCRFCQNWQLSHERPECNTIDRDSLVSMALACKENDTDCLSIAYTYSEPLVWYEYLIDTAPAMQAAGLKTILVSNGYINQEPLNRLKGFIDAANIDVKGFNDEYYRRTCGGTLRPVLKTVETLHEAGCHVEVTMLLIPGLNDDKASMAAFTDWVAAINPEMPVHFTRYFPCYKLDIPATPIATLLMARDIAKGKLYNVYVGNADLPEANGTYCRKCGKIILARSPMHLSARHTRDGGCEYCGADCYGRGL